MSEAMTYMDHLDRAKKIVARLEAGEEDIEAVIPALEQGYESLSYISKRIDAVEKAASQLESLFVQSQ